MRPSQPAHLAVLIAQPALALGIAAWTGWSALGAAAAVVLLLPMRSIARGNTYTCGWVSMLVVAYCAFLLAELYAQPQAKLWPGVLSLLAALNFVSLLLYVRLRARERTAQTAA